MSSSLDGGRPLVAEPGFNWERSGGKACQADRSMSKGMEESLMGEASNSVVSKMAHVVQEA